MKHGKNNNAMNNKILKYCIVGIIALTGCNQQERTTPQRKDIVDVVFASGSIITDNDYMVTSQSEGYLVKSFVEEGDKVSTGQPLFHIYDDAQKVQLESAEANYRYALSNSRPNSAVLMQLNAQLIQAKNKLSNDSLNFRRYQNLVKSNAVSQADYDKAMLSFDNSQQELQAIENQIADTKKNLSLDLIRAKASLASQQSTSSYYTLSSAVDGTVLQKFKKDGELVKKGETVAEIGSGAFIAKLFISEEDINKIKLGQDVYIELNTEKNRGFQAIISKIYPSFDTQEQSFVAEARFIEPIMSIKSGTQLQANIVIQQKRDALVVPTNYLLPNNNVMIADGRKKVEVTVGIKTTQWTEILKGLDENTTIVLPN